MKFLRAEVTKHTAGTGEDAKHFERLEAPPQQLGLLVKVCHTVCPFAASDAVSLRLAVLSKHLSLPLQGAASFMQARIKKAFAAHSSLFWNKRMLKTTFVCGV